MLANVLRNATVPALAFGLLAASACADSVLYSQPMTAGGGVARASQLWQDPSGQNDSDNDAIAWENFTLAQNSQVTQVKWWGAAPLAQGFRISFFNQDPNTVALQPDIFAPGSGPIYTQTVTNYTMQGDGSGMYKFTATLNTPVTFQGGVRYFVSVVGLTPLSYVSWGWAQGTGSAGGTFWWQRGAHMYFHLGDERALELMGNPAGSTPELLAYDGFDGGVGDNLDGQHTGTGWVAGWTQQNFDTDTTYVQDGLIYPGLASTAGAAGTPVGVSAYPVTDYVRSYGALPQGTTSLYVSFLMRPEPGCYGWGGLKFGTYPYAMTVGAPPGWWSIGLMLSEGLGDASNVSIVEGETYLVVAKISKNAGSGTTYRLFLNPTIGQAEPSFPLAQYASPVSTLPTALSLTNGSGWTTDEVRVGTTWQSVLPAGTTCVGDLDQDGTVDGTDLGLLLGAWGTGAADLDNSGVTDGTDLGLLLGKWGNCP